MILALFTFVLAQLFAPQSGTPTHGQWGDQRDGTYSNPVLPGDFSDLDAIRVGSHFYAITSTFQYSPGMAILESEDLLQWRFIGHVVDDLTRISPELNWDRMNRAGRGIWAGSIRFNGGRFWVYFGTPDEGLFMSTATDPAGPWVPPVAVLLGNSWDDPCPFWDDDGPLYLVTTNFRPDAAGVPYNIHLFKLTTNGQAIVAGSDRVIHHSRGSEANKLYKIGGVYFHYYSEVAPEGRVIMMERAKSLEGPWETKQLIHVHGGVDKEPNQGGLIELSDGRWYFFSHQGKGEWEGRAAVLLPVTWTASWPIIGAPGADGIGNMIWRGLVPFPGKPRRAEADSPAVSDDFDATRLDPAWEWNYQPRAGKWSLTERRGFLRLDASALYASAISFPPLTYLPSARCVPPSTRSRQNWTCRAWFQGSGLGWSTMRIRLRALPSFSRVRSARSLLPWGTTSNPALCSHRLFCGCALYGGLRDLVNGATRSTAEPSPILDYHTNSPGLTIVATASGYSQIIARVTQAG